MNINIYTALNTTGLDDNINDDDGLYFVWGPVNYAKQIPRAIV